jgi:hypothetical protein
MSVQRGSGRPTTVLVVEDEALIRLTVVEQLIIAAIKR